MLRQTRTRQFVGSRNGPKHRTCQPGERPLEANQGEFGQENAGQRNPAHQAQQELTRKQKQHGQAAEASESNQRGHGRTQRAARRRTHPQDEPAIALVHRHQVAERVENDAEDAQYSQRQRQELSRNGE